MRSRTIIAVAVMQAAYVVMMAVGTGVCIRIAMAERGKPNEEAWPLALGAVVSGIGAVLYALSVRGLWRVRRWGWVLALALNGLISVLVLWDIFIDHDHDPDNWVAIALFGLPVTLLLLPVVRRPFWQKRPLAVKPLTNNC